MTYFIAVANEKQEIIDRALELHDEVDSSDCLDPVCCPSQDERTFCGSCGVVYPCDTRKILEGKQA